MMRQRRTTCGFTLVEIAIALFVFSMIILLFGATFPTATRGSHVGSNYAQATLLAQHKIDQLRDTGFAGLNGANLAAMQIVDSSTQNADGSYSFTLSDNLVDNGTNKGFYPAGSTGTILFGPALTSLGTNAPGVALALQVTVTIQWQGGNQSSGQFSTHTIIASR